LQKKIEEKNTFEDINLCQTFVLCLTFLYRYTVASMSKVLLGFKYELPSMENLR
jgi:hypothetical protein